MAAEMAMEVRAGEVEERTAVKFDPPVGTQRYMAVCQILSRDPSIHKVSFKHVVHVLLYVKLP